MIQAIKTAFSVILFVALISGLLFFNLPMNKYDIFRLPDREKPQQFVHHDCSDRIIEQLQLTSSDLISLKNKTRLKRILLYNGIENWYDIPISEGQNYFKRSKCPVDLCSLTSEKKYANSVDAIIFRNGKIGDLRHASKDQVWILYQVESPYLSHSSFREYSKVFNWTSSYRRDSDVPAVYAKFVRYNSSLNDIPLQRNYALHKTKKVAWFVSNCYANNNRLEYAKELSKYIQVDIYGKCGTKTCPRSMEEKCFEHIRKNYKFYLAFENANCRDYITEKFFINALSNDIIPVVMGPPREDYECIAPHHSFIHVEDFDSPKDLANYLHLLDIHDTLYNDYFKWKGSGEIWTDDRYLCRVCAMLHTKYATKTYDDLYNWWRGPGICRKGPWRNS